MQLRSLITKIFPLSEQSLTVYFEQKISLEVHQQVQSLRAWLLEHPIDGVLEIVCSYASLTLFFDLRRVNFEQLKNYILSAEITPNHQEKKRIIELPVRYNGTDLEEVCAQKKLAKDQLIDIHSSSIYHVFMIGFLPGFPYMGMLDERLFVPRKQKPVSKVAKGSVAIAGFQTGIYSLDSPGGWHVIGECTLELFDPNRNPITLLEAGDQVKFFPV